MLIEQTRWIHNKGWMPAPPGDLGAKAQLVLLFGSPARLRETARLAKSSAPKLGMKPSFPQPFHLNTQNFTAPASSWVEW